MESEEKHIVPDRQTLTYESYLHVKELLMLQHPLSAPEEHDETLFIVIHQVYELWFKQILHEVELCARELRRDFLPRVSHALKRILAIQRILLQQVEILETMIPDDFARFRGNINPSSGFQSYQFRLTEFRLGMKNQAYLKYFSHEPPVRELLETAMAQPSLYDEFLCFLRRRGLAIPAVLNYDEVSGAYLPHVGVTDVYALIYRQPAIHSDIYLTLEGLLDIDQHFILWRHRHVTMVERMIGSKTGTGGSTGAKYLRSTLEKRFFPEIWEVRNRLGTSY